MPHKFEKTVETYELEELDSCEECTGYGDDYYFDEDGEIVLRCPTCSFNKNRWEETE